MTPHAIRSSLPKRLALAILIGSVVAVVTLEAVLQAGALIVGAAGRGPTAGWLTGNVRILALGDSNTYGVLLPEEQSFPAQFEALWNAEVGAPKIEVLNLGYPGTNSSVLLRNLPGLLDTFQPDVVFVMIGANDFWTDSVDADESAPSAVGAVRHWLRQHSRVYKLAYMLRRSIEGTPVLDTGERYLVDVDTVDAAFLRERRAQISRERAEGKRAVLDPVRYGDAVFELGFVLGTGRRGDAEVLRHNVSKIVERILRHGSEPVLLTYPSSHEWYGLSNEILRREAGRRALRLVDIAAGLRSRCPEPLNCPELFFPDQHAKQPGYAIAARTLVDELRRSGFGPEDVSEE